MEKYSALTGAENIGKLYGEILSQLKDGARHSSKIYNVDYKNDGLQLLAAKLVEEQTQDLAPVRNMKAIGTQFANTMNQLIEGANSTGSNYNERNDHVGIEALALKIVSKEIGLDQPQQDSPRRLTTLERVKAERESKDYKKSSSQLADY